MTSSKGRLFAPPAVQCFQVDVLRQLEGDQGTGEAPKNRRSLMGSIFGRSNVISGSADVPPSLTRILFRDQAVSGNIYRGAQCLNWGFDGWHTEIK